MTAQEVSLGSACHIGAHQKGPIPEKWGRKVHLNFVARTEQESGNQNENLFLGMEAHGVGESYTLWSNSSREIIIEHMFLLHLIYMIIQRTIWEFGDPP